MLLTILLTVLTVIPILICIAFFTLFERKVIGAIQRRKGPNVIGLVGLLQPFADGLKLILKETIIPAKANKIIFIGGSSHATGILNTLEQNCLNN